MCTRMHMYMRERVCELIVYLSLFPLHPTSKALESVFYHKPAQYWVLSLYTNTLFSTLCFSFLLSKRWWVFLEGGGESGSGSGNGKRSA